MSDKKTYYEWQDRERKELENTLRAAVQKAQADHVFRAGLDLYRQGVEYYLSHGLALDFAEELSREVILHSLYLNRNPNSQETGENYED